MSRGRCHPAHTYFVRNPDDPAEMYEFACDGIEAPQPAPEGFVLPPPPPRGEDHIMQFFTYDHLPDKLKAVSMPFCTLAMHVVETLPRNPERTTALRKLLEAKDAAVRAQVAK